MFDAGSIIFNIKAAGAQVFRQELDQADASVKKLGTSQKQTARDTENLGKKQDELGKKSKQMSSDVKAAYTSVGTAAVGMGAAILGVTTLSVKAATEWQSAWAGVTKTVDGTPEALAEVESGLRSLTGVLPASHTEIAAVAEAAGQLGVQTGNVVAFTKTMIDLGETTNLSANDAATALARFMNVMGTAQDKTSNLGSSVVALGNNYATTEAEIVNMATRLSGAARQVGLTEGETMGLAAALSSVGIEAEAGGSAVSKVMIDIAASVDKGGERVERFAKISGISADEFTKKWRTDPGAALALFVKGLADAEAQGGTTLGMLEELGITETRMRDALLRSAAASDQFTDAMGLGNKAFEENNALTEEAAKRYETVESQLGIMKNNVVDAAISFGEVFLPALVAVSQGVSDFAGVMGDLPEPLQGALSILGAVTGAVFLMGGMMMLAVPKIVEFRLALATLRGESVRLDGGLKNLRGTLLLLTSVAILAWVAQFTGGLIDSARETLGLKENVDSLKKSMDEVGAKKTVDLVAGDGLNTLAALTDGGFWSDLNRGLQETVDSASDWMLGFKALGVEGQLVTNKLATLDKTMAALVAAGDTERAAELYEELASRTDGSKEAIDRLNQMLPEYSSVQEDATKVTKSAAGAYLEAAEEAEGLTSELDQLIDKVNEANGVGQDAVSANASYQQSLVDAKESVAEFAKEHGVGAHALDMTTAAGSANMDMLSDLAADYQDAAKAQFDLDGNTENYVANLTAGRDAVLQRAKDLGATDEQIKFLTAHIVAMPTDKEVKIIADTSNAAARLQRIRDLMDGIGATSTLHISTARGRGGMMVEADGGVVDYFASGGFSGARENHVAQIAAAGTMRVWAEPETGGEAYIPLAKSKRGRSLAIWEETGRRLGAFADGGGVGGTPSGAGSLEQVFNVYALDGMSAQTVGRAAAEAANDAWKRSK